MTYVRQSTEYTCGPAALSMALERAGVHAPYRTLIADLGTSPAHGTSARALIREARRRGARVGVRRGATLAALEPLLARGRAVLICYWLPADRTGHYALITRITREFVHLADPWHGPTHRLSRAAFLRRWHGTNGLRRWALVID